MNKLEQLAERALDAQLIAQEAKEQADDAKAAFEAALEAEHKLNPDFKAIGHVRVKIVKNRFFDIAKAEALLPKRVLKECTVPKLDAALVKNHLNPLQLESCMQDHARAWKIGLSVLED